MTSYQEKVISAAADGALVLTSNKRLSRYFRALFDQSMEDSGRSSWPTPQILSLDAWLDRQFAELGDEWHVLQGAPLKRLWEQIIEEDSSGSERELLQVSATADKARQAAELVSEYGVVLELESKSPDQEAFYRWMEKFKAICLEKRWLLRSEMALKVVQQLSVNKLEYPQRILLCGFDQPSPVLQKLYECILQQGGTIEELKPSSEITSQTCLHAAEDSEQEVVQAARWTRKLLEQGASSIGIVVTDLQSRRSLVERIFREQLDPASSANFDEQETAFSISLGAPLIEQGPISAAFEVLGAERLMPLDKVSFLLRTPYLGYSQSEADSRARLDTQLRSFRQQFFPIDRLAERCSGKHESTNTTRRVSYVSVPGFSRILKSIAARDAKNQKRTPGDWAATFDHELQEAGWPGDHGLSSLEYQILKAWNEKLLTGFAALDLVSQRLERTQALSLLRRMAAEIEFQQESQDGPVQVLGLLESAGLEFDHLWVMGLTEAVMPAAARPNPFIPVPVQVACQMPHSSAERELEFSRNVIARLRSACPHSIFSYAKRDGDCDLRPSPLVSSLPAASPEFAPQADLCTLMKEQAPELSSIRDDRGPALSESLAKGGTGILRDQARCPFRAYARHRLGVYGFDEAEPGLDSMTRGNLSHRALELFWQEVKTQQCLIDMSEQLLIEIISRTVRQALVDCLDDFTGTDNEFLLIEQRRLERLVEDWLTSVELKRDAFAVVALEEERVEQIGSLRIRTIVDRIDRLEDGGQVILDYKTGNVEAELLIGERLLEPQLPIYATSKSDFDINGVAFAQVRRGNSRFLGVSREPGTLPRVDGVEKHKKASDLNLQNWEEVLAHWRSQIEFLADNFASGAADVDPVDEKYACRYCNLNGLCRISEARPAGGKE